MSMELCWSDEDLEDVERTAIQRGEDIEHKRIVDIIEELDLSEFVKDEVIHAIARG